MESGLEATADALAGVVEMSNVPAFIEGGGKELETASICPAKAVPSGLAAQIKNW